jgi:polysaccharide export outer membrane protein
MGYPMRALKPFAALMALASLLVMTFAFTGPAMADNTLPGPSSQLTHPAPQPQPQMQIPSTSVASAPVSASSGAGDDSYRLGAGDKLKITVYGEEDLSGEFTVDGTGQIQLPLVGQIHATGLTIHEFVASVVKLLSANYLRDPKVSVQIENYRPFYIIGEVNKPGEFPFEDNLNVLAAVALAGGYTYRADDDDVYIRRNGETKEQRLPANATTRIYPGDIVRIAERIF